MLIEDQETPEEAMANAQISAFVDSKEVVFGSHPEFGRIPRNLSKEQLDIIASKYWNLETSMFLSEYLNVEIEEYSIA